MDGSKPGFVGYDKDGHFLHYCHCGKWGAHGYNVNRSAGLLGDWYCFEHKPKEGARDDKDRPKGTTPARDA